MSEISVHVLGEDDWQDYREVRLAALQESPEAFLATYAEESAQPEQYWRDRMTQGHRLLVKKAGATVGVASVTLTEDAPQSADVSELWIAPEFRNTGVASRLVQAAADQAARDGCTQLYYWVSTENGRAIGFASNAGFRGTSQRRTTSLQNPEFGDREIAFVLSLDTDPGAVPTSASARLSSRSGPA